MNVYIRERDSEEPVVRYEVHLVENDQIPADEAYFNEAWRRARADGLVSSDRSLYKFQLQRPKGLFEASR